VSVIVDPNCFADEIAIDFPSVDPMLARAVEGFLSEADRVRTLRAEVSLSSDEAERGAVVPLDVPIRGTCRECGGRGETWAEPCASCHGTGDRVFRHRVKLSVPPRIADGSRLNFRVRAPHESPVRVEAEIVIRANDRYF
jgi:hypothetical protein